jgi:hypothetical protein
MISNEERIANLEELCKQLLADTAVLQIALRAHIEAYGPGRMVRRRIANELYVGTVRCQEALQESGVGYGCDLSSLMARIGERSASWQEYVLKRR